jgi:hypothetical protein
MEGRYHALIALCVTTSRSEVCSGEAGSRKQKKTGATQHRIHTIIASKLLWAAM